MADKLTINQAYFIARQYVQAKPISWDYLNGTNDLRSYLQDDMTEAQVYAVADKAYNDRLKESNDLQVKS